MRFQLFCFVFIVALAANTSSSLATGCRCPKESSGFVKSYKASYTVVRAHVLQQWTTCYLCSSPTNRENAIRIYAMFTLTVFKKPHPGEIFYAQAFENPDYCGVRLQTGQTYMLNLDNPRKISSASSWNRGWYVLNACQSHFNWNALGDTQQKYLLERVHRLSCNETSCLN